jgi:carboxymethylenebutenolidase
MPSWVDLGDRGLDVPQRVDAEQLGLVSGNLHGDLDVAGDARSPAACRRGCAASISNGVNRCTHREAVTRDRGVEVADQCSEGGNRRGMRRDLRQDRYSAAMDVESEGAVSGYLSKPQVEVAGQPPWPGVVVVHDAFGLGDDIRQITDRFATAGYLALAPDLYSRGGMMRCVKAVFSQLMAATGPAFDDIEAARTTLAGRSDCTGKIGVVGFCMGGGFALVAASRNFDASAPYYGLLPKDESIFDGACPIVASYGGRDRTLSGAADKLERALSQRNVAHDVKEYPRVGHGFANRIFAGPLNQVARIGGFHYDHESSDDAWRRVMVFFAKHLR